MRIMNSENQPSPIPHGMSPAAAVPMEIDDPQDSRQDNRQVIGFNINFSKVLAAQWNSRRRTGGQAKIVLADSLVEEATRMNLWGPAPTTTEARNGLYTDIAKGWEEREKALIDLVYGSNKIENAGTNRRLTTKICTDVFRGRDVDANLPKEGNLEYMAYLLHLMRTNRLKKDQYYTEATQSHREVVNHAKALVHLAKNVGFPRVNRPWTEQLIRETHSILHDGISKKDVVPGVYRDYEMGVSYTRPGGKAKTSRCIRAAAVPGYMKDMVEKLNADAAAVEASGVVDPYTLAARYHHQFAMIHPFGDGNGRMARLILSVLLLRYAGHVAPFGVDDIREYLNIVNQGARVWHLEDGEVGFEEFTSHFEFARFLLRKSKGSFGRM